MTLKPQLNPCPFCGVVTDVPHETQKSCIQALHAEIARTRQVLDQVRDPRFDSRLEDVPVSPTRQ